MNEHDVESLIVLVLLKNSAEVVKLIVQDV